jgi:RND superfamily putative drug exporter
LENLVRFSAVFGRIADLTWAHPRRVLAVVGVFAIGAGAFGARVDQHLKPAGFGDPESESHIASERLLGELGYDAVPGIAVLVSAKADGGKLRLDSPVLRREARRLSRELESIGHVRRVVNPLDGGPRNHVARDRSSFMLSAHLDSRDEDVRGDAAARARDRLDSEHARVRVGGFATAFNDVNEAVREDLLKAELIAFPLLLVLLLIVFRGVVASFIPLAIGGLSIVGAYFALRVMSAFVDTSIFALNIVTALGLGLAVDYGLLLVSRYREELEREGPTRDAHRRVVETAGRTVLYSGFTVAAALAALVVFPQRFLYSMGAGGAFVALFAAAIALFTVPALLALLGTRVNALSVRRGPAVSDVSGGWYRLARAVMRRPVPIALASAAVLLVAAAPLAGATWTGPSAETVPSGFEARVVSDAIARDFAPEVEYPISVTVEGAASKAELARLGARIDSLGGIRGATPFRRISDDVAQANFGPAGSPLGDTVQAAVRDIRRLDAPARVLVSGNTAEFIDLKDSLVAHLPVVVGLITATTLLLLFMLTGSLILPIKTLIMNTLTLAATLGVVVIAFQHGVLHAPLGYDGPSAIEVSMLVVLFAVTFGLATDYAVLVMARIKELHDQGLPNEEAVATGIARTGRVITAAAMLLAVVFLCFTTGRIFFMKEIGIGQAAAVLIDASIVRALLVPSLMRLFGDWNWWAPRPLRLVHERLAERRASPSIG